MKLRTFNSILVLSIPLLWGVSITTAANDDPWDRKFSIVSPQWLISHLNDKNMIILDVRPDLADYQTGHIPGAIHFPEDLVRSPRGGLPAQNTPPEIIEDIFGRAGIEDGDLAVIYSDGEDVLGASMVAYALLRAGHRRTALLNGGYTAYRQQYPVTQEYPHVSPADYEANLDEDLFITFEDLKDELSEDDPDIKLIDVRSARAYAGRSDRWIRSGHIPGAVNSDWRLLMSETNPHRFRSIDRMQDVIRQTGVDENDDIVLYCNTSREATLTFLVMKYILGYDDVRLYEGSWTEYNMKMEMPVIEGPSPGPFIKPAEN